MLSLQVYRAGLIFFLLSWMVSIHIRPWVNFHSEMMALAAICMLVASQFLRYKQSVHLPKIYGWAIFIILIPWLQFAAGINFFAGDAFVSSLYSVGLLGALFIGYSYASVGQSSEAPLSGFMHMVWSAALLSAAIGLLQWLGLEEILGIYVVQGSIGDRVLGNLGQPNQLATLLLIGMAALAFAYERAAVGRFPFFLGIGFLSFVLVLTQSRTAMLSVVLLTAFLIWKRRTVELRLSARAVATWALLFFIVTLLLPSLNNAMLLGEVRSVADHAPINERYLLWQQILYAISQSPWLGYGWNQTAVAHIAAAATIQGSTPFIYAHNVVLDMMAWNGVPLGIILTGVCGYWFVTRIKRVRQPDAVFAMACLLPFALHSMLEYPFAYSYFLVTAGVMAGIVEASMVGGKLISLTRPLAWTALAVYTTVGVYFIYEYLLVEEDFRVARFEMLSIGQTPNDYQVPHIWMNTHLAALLKATRQVVEPGMTSVAIDNMKSVASRFPNGPATARYALALGLNEKPQEARHQMAVVRGLYGEQYYQSTRQYFVALKEEKYPELKAVLAP